MRADTVPGQQRINGKMASEEKLAIALSNKIKRINEQQKLAQRGIYIEYTGKNTPMGIPGNGVYDESEEHKAAIMAVGQTVTETVTKIQEESEQVKKAVETAILVQKEIEEVKKDLEKATTPAPTPAPTPPATTTEDKQPIIELLYNYKGYHDKITLYHNDRYKGSNNSYYINYNIRKYMKVKEDATLREPREVYNVLLKYKFLTQTEARDITMIIINNYDVNRHDDGY